MLAHSRCSPPRIGGSVVLTPAEAFENVTHPLFSAFLPSLCFLHRMSAEFLISILQIIVIDIVLSGDNAVVIAMAAHKLPAYQRKRAILWGGGIAIFLRIVFTMVMSFLLMVPGLRLVGGLVLAWIACKLLIGEEEGEISPDNADKGALAAIRMIFIADLMMSLDNMLAVAGASHGNAAMLLMGLVVSIAIIMTCSNLIARLMNRYHWIVYAGAAILAFTAGQMMLGDRELAGFFIRSQHIKLSSHWDEWLISRARVTTFDPSKVPADLKDAVQFRDGELTVAGPLTYDQYHALLDQYPEPTVKAAVEGQGWFSRLWSGLTSTKNDRAAIEELYQHSRVEPVPSWVPAGLRSKVELWFQHKWPAENWRNVQGREYSYLEWIFYAIVLAVCLSTNRWWPGKRGDAASESTTGGGPAPLGETKPTAK